MDQVWMDLRKAVFDLQEDDSLSQVLMASTLTIVQNQGSKNKNLMESVLNKVHQATVGDPNIACPFTSPAFHLAFKVIREAIWLLKDKSEIVEKGLDIIAEHAGLEGADVDEVGLLELDVLHPKYLPRKDMLCLLVDLLAHMVSTQSSQTQHAVRALISVCNSGQCCNTAARF